jgi:hypothetical protein
MAPLHPHGYVDMTNNPKLTDWSENQSLDEFGTDGDKEEEDSDDE